MNPENKRTVVVLGSTDPEMVEINKVANAAGCTVICATCIDDKTKDRRPVRPGEVADKGCIDEIYSAMLACSANRLILVEQLGKANRGNPQGILGNTGTWALETYAVADGWPVQVLEVDHHDPAQTWPDDMPLFERSSLGQICKLLGVEPDQRQRDIGALDHSLPGAIQEARKAGRLDEVLLTYANGAAHLFGGVEPEVYVQQAKDTAGKLDQLQISRAGWVKIYALPPDPSTAGVTGEHYPLPALPLALALCDRAGLSIIRRKDGVFAWRLQCATAVQVNVFLEHQIGLLRHQLPPNAPYGQPERGFAGGVVEPGFLAQQDWGGHYVAECQKALLKL